MEHKNTSSVEHEHLENLARLIRYWALDMSTTAGSGHPTSSLSATDLMTALMFGGFFHFDVTDKDSPHNDRLIFSKGHASPLFYALWAAAGQIPPEDLKTFRKIDSYLEGHPTPAFAFTEASTGSLGQGLSIGLGMALANKKLDQTDAKVYVLLGDSEMAEGSVWEAMNVAAHYQLDNLVGIIDVNRLGQRGETMQGHDVETYRQRAEAFGWKAVVVDGHDMAAIVEAFDSIGDTQDGTPTMLIAKTLKGKGVSFIEDKEDWHGVALSEEDFAKATEELGEVDTELRGVIAKPFLTDNEPRKYIRGKQLTTDNEGAEEMPNYQLPIINYASGDPIATRDAYGSGLVQLMKIDPKVVVLDAEVSNSTKAAAAKEAFPERFFEMFIAEQNMAGVALGLARRGYKPFASSFAAFLTRAADQIRMAQYSHGNVAFVGSHAGVSIGEDGASQMALEDFGLFRPILGSVVLYPSDAVSTEQLVGLCAQHEGVTYLRTTRGKTPVLYEAETQFAIGGSTVLRHSANDVVTIVAAGITLHEALKAYAILEEKGMTVRVIDLYSIKPIDAETLHTAAAETAHILTVEDHYAEGGIGEAVRTALGAHAGQVHSLAVTKMPHSGKPEELLAYEGIDAAAIVAKVEALVSTGD